ncbi:hypothetical protein H5410_011603 [Solanum commersonii]|uniref:Uncharacterized protein n=1 Tax=Solanum commersonii TaxID=4109 RepID=A0A9J6APY5_SOLCO|nr:hypothetical protein H5410_011603 [Solanum commersonii]
MICVGNQTCSLHQSIRRNIHILHLPKVKEISTHSSFLTWTTKRTGQKWIPLSTWLLRPNDPHSIRASPSASVANVITHGSHCRLSDKSYTSSGFANEGIAGFAGKEKEVMMLTTWELPHIASQPPPGYLIHNTMFAAIKQHLGPPRPMQNHRNNAPRPSFEKASQSSLHCVRDRTQLWQLKEAGNTHPVEAKSVNAGRVV